MSGGVHGTAAGVDSASSCAFLRSFSRSNQLRLESMQRQHRTLAEGAHHHTSNNTTQRLTMHDTKAIRKTQNGYVPCEGGAADEFVTLVTGVRAAPMGQVSSGGAAAAICVGCSVSSSSG